MRKNKKRHSHHNSQHSGCDQMQKKVLSQKLNIFITGGDGNMLHMGYSHLSWLILIFRMPYGTSHIEQTYNSIKTHNMTHVKCPHKHWHTLKPHTASYSKHPTYLIQTKLHKPSFFSFFFSGITAHFRDWPPQICSPILKQLNLLSCSFQSPRFLYSLLCCLPSHWCYPPLKSLLFHHMDMQIPDTPQQRRMWQKSQCKPQRK